MESLHRLRYSHCPSCLRNLRRTISPRSVGLQNSPRIRQRHFKSRDEQAYPLSGYYSEILNEQTRNVSPVTQTDPTTPPEADSPTSEREEAVSKARIVFGSRLAGPAERQSRKESQSTNVAGLLVPPRPDEPDNCCMSGCVNCVWDLYRDDLEEWAAKSAQARERLLSRRMKGQASGGMKAESSMPEYVATSMENDGGRSETSWEFELSESEKDEDLFKNIPVGIREFMRTEKMLKEKHMGEKARV